MKWNKDIDVNKLSRICSISLTKGLLISASNRLEYSTMNSAVELIRREFNNAIGICNKTTPIIMAQITDFESMSVLICFGFSKKELLSLTESVNFYFRISLG